VSGIDIRHIGHFRFAFNNPVSARTLKMTNAHRFAALSDADISPAFQGWLRRSLSRVAAALDRLADAELAVGQCLAVERLAWLAAGIRDGAA
jgi:hypothetical protein